MKFFKTFLAIIVVSCIACITGCSSDDDLNPIIGTWRNSDAEGNCIADWIISKDGSFEFSAYSDCEGCGCYEFDMHGTWAIANGLLYVNITDYSDPEKLPDWYQPDIDIPHYFFITATGKLSITAEDNIYERDGSGTGIVGTWHENGECYKDYIFYTNGTYDYEECDDIFNGDYVTSGDRLTLDIDTEDEEVMYFKVFGNYLAIDNEEDLFTRQ